MAAASTSTWCGDDTLVRSRRCCVWNLCRSGVRCDRRARLWYAWLRYTRLWCAGLHRIGLGSRRRGEGISEFRFAEPAARAAAEEWVSHVASTARRHRQNDHRRDQRSNASIHSRFLDMYSERIRRSRIRDRTKLRLDPCCANATCLFRETIRLKADNTVIH